MLVLPVMLAAVGSAANYSVLHGQLGRLQAAADAGTLAAAKAVEMADFRTDNVQAIVDGKVKSFLADNHDNTYAGGAVTVEAKIDSTTLEINVLAKQRVQTPFGGMFGTPVSEIAAASAARVVGKPNICVLALESSEIGAIWLEQSARLTGNGCAVFSNSTSGTGIVVRDSALMTAATVCSAGGVAGKGSITPEALIDCPTFTDPLASRPEPAVPAKCDYTQLQVKDQDRTLSPGTYCGGLAIRGTARVTFEPGLYIIKDGLFTVTEGAEIIGKNAGFFLSGYSTFLFGPNSTISLDAPKDGPLAGIIFFGSRSQSKLVTHSILSNNARQLLGTIYLPRNSLIVDATAPVASESAYTAIVARRVVLLSGPNLVLNSKYEETDIPVPQGIRGVDMPVALVK